MRRAILLGLLVFGLFANITPQAKAPPSGIEITDPIIRVDEIHPPQPEIFNIEAKDNIL